MSVFVRRLKEGRTFAGFVEDWEADEGFGVPTRVFNAQSLDDPRDVISVGFRRREPRATLGRPGASADAESARHERIETVVESTTPLRCMYELHTEHDFTATPRELALDSPESLLAALTARG